jgi:hypothetical protein
MSDLLDLVARAIWAERRELAALKGIVLEEWGDGSIPIANHIHSEALAAISVMRHLPPEPLVPLAKRMAGNELSYDADANTLSIIVRAVIDEALA